MHITDDKNDRHIDAATTKSFSFKGIRSLITTKLKTGGRLRRTKVQYKMDIDSDGNLMQISIFQHSFPRVTIEHLANHEEGSVI